MTIYIFGAGPTGLAVGEALIDNGISDFVIFESKDQIGGLATTIKWDDIGYHDLGPHKLYTQNEALFEKVKSILPDSMWLNRNKVSSIFINGHFLNYPPNPLSLFKVYGLFEFIKIVASFIKSKFIPIKIPLSFRDDLINRIGAGIYNILFHPMATKLWGEPSQLSIKLSKGRIQTPSIFELMLSTIGLRKKSDFEALTFIYPRGGLITIWDALKNKIGSRRIILSAKIEDLNLESGRIKSFNVSTQNQEKSFVMQENDLIISTLPLLKTYKSISEGGHNSVLDEAKKSFKLNDLYLIFLHLDTDKLFEESWIFVPDPKISFHRLSEQGSFDPSMVISGSILCAEVMMMPGRFKDSITESELVDICVGDLRKVVKKQFMVMNSKVIKLRESYPVYEIGYELVLEKVMSQMDNISNFKTVGRQGSFNYIGTLDAMDIGYGLVEWYLNSDSLSWQSERKRTSHFPVLD